MNRFLPIFIVIVLVFSFQLTAFSMTKTQTITLSAIVDEHLTWRKEGNNLIVSTNKPEGFILHTNGERITKKGPIILTVPNPSSFILTSGY